MNPTAPLTAAHVARIYHADARAFRAWMRRRGIGGRKFVDAKAGAAAIALFNTDTRRFLPAAR